MEDVELSEKSPQIEVERLWLLGLNVSRFPICPFQLGFYVSRFPIYRFFNSNPTATNVQPRSTAIFPTTPHLPKTLNYGTSCKIDRHRSAVNLQERGLLASFRTLRGAEHALKQQVVPSPSILTLHISKLLTHYTVSILYKQRLSPSLKDTSSLLSFLFSVFLLKVLGYFAHKRVYLLVLISSVSSEQFLLYAGGTRTIYRG